MSNWNSQEDVEQFNEKRSLKRFELYKKFREASLSGDKEATEKARATYRKYNAQDSKYKEKAEKEGYCWY